MDVRARSGLIAVGLVLIVIGAFIAISPNVSLNLGNQCTVDMGCRNVSGSVSYVALGIVSAVVGLLIVIYGLRKSED